MDSSDGDIKEGVLSLNLDMKFRDVFLRFKSKYFELLYSQRLIWYYCFSIINIVESKETNLFVCTSIW
jgi:hypothetical protein